MATPTVDQLLAEAQQIVTDLQAFKVVNDPIVASVATLTAANATLTTQVAAANAALTTAQSALAALTTSDAALQVKLTKIRQDISVATQDAA
jgi:hypothetical protein